MKLLVVLSIVLGVALNVHAQQYGYGYYSERYQPLSLSRTRNLAGKDDQFVAAQQPISPQQFAGFMPINFPQQSQQSQFAQPQTMQLQQPQQMQLQQPQQMQLQLPQSQQLQQPQQMQLQQPQSQQLQMQPQAQQLQQPQAQQLQQPQAQQLQQPQAQQLQQPQAQQLQQPQSQQLQMQPQAQQLQQPQAQQLQQPQSQQLQMQPQSQQLQQLPQSQQLQFNPQQSMQIKRDDDSFISQQILLQKQQQDLQQQMQQQQLQQQIQQQQAIQQQAIQQQQAQQRISSFPQQAPVQQKVSNQKPKENFCLNKEAQEVIPHPSNPHQFIVCHKGAEFDVMNCPSNLIFNPNLKRCDNNMRSAVGCSSKPCQNGGICTDLSFFKFKCDCPVGFTGEKCEREDVCATNTCGPSGVCVPHSPGNPVKSYCLCNNGKTFGLSCDHSAEINPCIDSNAENFHFPIKSNPSIFVHCDGNLPTLKFCPWPLVFAPSKQECDWKSA